MKIALGFALIASAMVWIVGADVFGDRKSEIRTLKTAGVSVITNKPSFVNDLDAIATLPLWTVDFQYFNTLPLPDFRIPNTVSINDNSAPMPVARFSIKEAIQTGMGSLGTGNFNKIVAQVPGPEIVASLEIDNSATPTGKIEITMNGPMIGWGAQFKGIQERLKFTLSYAGSPFSADFPYTYDPAVNGANSFIGFVSNTFPITKITIEVDTATVVTNFLMDDVVGAKQDAPSSTPSRSPSRKPSANPSRTPSAKPSRKPSAKPSATPSRKPSAKPSRKPSAKPSRKPSAKPSVSRKPSAKPSARPSKMPTAPDDCPLANIPIIGIVFWLICRIFDLFG